MTTILDPLIQILLAILTYAHDNLGLNWGWSIVVLTVIVRVVLIPLTWKQFKSMRALQAVQPQMKELQEKHKDDRQLLNQKMMEFYKENKVNPFGSCLPLILQMPVFFALFYMLQAEAGAGGHFATDNQWLWMQDWSWAPSWVASNIIEFDLPLLILYVASQFVSSLMMVQKDSAQRNMMLAMPVAIGVIMYIGKWPAGLFIYWFTSNLWTIAQQLIITKVVPLPEPAAVVVSGGGSGGTRKKKQTKQPEKDRKR